MLLFVSASVVSDINIIAQYAKLCNSFQIRVCAKKLLCGIRSRAKGAIMCEIPQTVRISPKARIYSRASMVCRIFIISN